jgi:dipeptidyl aminopeptidase/acylaminoacyl peptidase
MLQGDTRERDMSFLDYSFAADLTPDAGVLLFDEEGEAGGANYTVFVRKADRSPVVRLGEGNAMAISPDGKWALSMLPVPNSPIILLPTGTGEKRQLAAAGVSPEQAATWLPDSQSILFAGSEPGHRLRLYVQDIVGGKPRAISPEGVVAALPGFAVSPDGKAVAAIGPDRKATLFPIDGGQAREIRGPADGEFPLRFSADGRFLYLWKRGDVPARVTRLEIATGKRETWKDLIPADPSGVERISNVLVTPDTRGYAYCFTRLLSDLFVVEGLK